MSRWFEVFDNEEVQLTTRRKVTTLCVLVVSAVILTFVCAIAAFSNQMTSSGGFWMVALIWTATAAWCGARLRRLRRVAWCLKVSNDSLVAYDYARKKTIIPWHDVSRIDWTGRSLLITGPPPCSIEIPDLFSDFAALSHTVYDCAARSNVPIYLESRELDDLDIHSVYPFLRDLSIILDASDSGDVATS
ncbi:MAG: hypothetical protein ACOCTG_01520 [Bacteroidota bacterium]